MVVAVAIVASPCLYLEQPVTQLATVLFAASLVAGVVVVVVWAFVLVVLVAVGAAVIRNDS